MAELQSYMVNILRQLIRSSGPSEVVDKQILARKYAALFPQQTRTVDFLARFAEIFGEDSSFCDELPQPVFCSTCTKKYVKNIDIIIKHLESLNKSEEIKVFDMIKYRLLEVDELIVMVIEDSRAAMERPNMDNVLEFLNINNDPYDPPSETVMEKCNTNKYQKTTEEESCVICICDFEEGEQVKKLVCGHQFHEACIMGWLNSNSTCPMCKASLKDDKEPEEIEAFNYLKTIQPVEEKKELPKPSSVAINMGGQSMTFNMLLNESGQIVDYNQCQCQNCDESCHCICHDLCSECNESYMDCQCGNETSETSETSESKEETEEEDMKEEYGDMEKVD